MALLDRLESALSTATQTRARLLNALLHQALTPPCGHLPMIQVNPKAAIRSLSAPIQRYFRATTPCPAAQHHCAIRFARNEP
ncbi:MAG: hypothetical protein GDA52_00505 [Rhodobacteraceae bacterium]|nr:hypothetical protein [Paracoccaceae bacterium]